MPSTLLPELAREISEAAARVLERHKGEALPENVVSLFTSGEQSPFLPGSPSYLIGVAWGEAKKILEQEAMEGRELKALCEAVIAAIDSETRLREQLAPEAGSSPASSDLTEKHAGDLGQIRQEADRLLELVNRPHPPIDWKRVEEAQEAYRRGEVERVDDVLRRLQDGEDV